MSDQYVFFWRTEKSKKIGPGCLSQWARCGFVVDGVYYRYAEQYMMAEKARLFHDDATLDKIMDAKSPMIVKRLGRSVKGRNGGEWDKGDAEKWDAVRSDVVVRGNFAKFSQNDALKEYLLSTGDAMIAEASPKDAVWGIGIDEKTAEKTPQSEWPGQNLLGKALMKVRGMLKNGEDDTNEVRQNKESLKQFIAEREAQQKVNAAFSKAKSVSKRKPAKQEMNSPNQTELECDAVRKLGENEKRSVGLFVATRMTLLRRVNTGDKKAFEEFYNVYCPAMLKYLGLTEEAKTEKDQLDLVQTVFAKFYKAFAMIEDPDTGKKRMPRDLMAAVKKDKKEGAFRRYLLRCLTNAVRSKWRKETKGGKVSVCSIDAKITPYEDTTWKDLLEERGVNPSFLNCQSEEEERLTAVIGIWKAVVKGFVFDEALDDSVRDITYRSIAEDVPVDDLARHWGVTWNNAYQIRHRSIKKAKKITREIYRLLGQDNEDIQSDVKRLYEAVSQMKPSKHVDKFMIGLAKELCGKRT